MGGLGNVSSYRIKHRIKVLFDKRSVPLKTKEKYLDKSSRQKLFTYIVIITIGIIYLDQL